MPSSRTRLPVALGVGVAIVAVLLTQASAHARAQGRLRERLRAQRGSAEEQQLTVSGRERTYVLHDFSGGRQAPLVIVLHGGGGNAENAIRMTGFDRVARREQLIAVYPNGSAARPQGPLLTWNAGHCCAAAMEQRVDDVGFVSALIDRLVADRRVDRTRVYVTGMSNGGMMSHRIGRELSTKVAAIAPVVGAVFGDEAAPGGPVPAFIVVGADDQVVPPAGGPLQLRGLFGNARAADRDVAPAMAQAEYWARANGCGQPEEREARSSTVREWRACSSGKPVIFQRVSGNGHAWPGGEPGRAGAAAPSRDFDASEEIWRFFARQSR